MGTLAQTNWLIRALTPACCLGLGAWGRVAGQARLVCFLGDCRAWMSGIALIRAVDLISAAANPVMGLIKHPRPARQNVPTASQPVMPVRDPVTTLAQITAAAIARLPGACIRRRLFFRYTLRWDKPR